VTGLFAGRRNERFEMNILGIESSCDETACAVVRDGREVLSSVVYTQIPLHRPYGGVVPEVASRAHIEKIAGVVAEAQKLFREKKPDGKVDAVAVTYGPGLASSLIVGLNVAKGLAAGLGVPLIGINHIEAHLHTPFLFDSGDSPSAPGPEEMMPALGLAVSGGHTSWVDMPAYGKYEIVGQTLDDAAGEAFDKAAKLLGLGYPGGPVMDRYAKAYWLKHDPSDVVSLKGAPYPEIGCLPDGLPEFPKGHPRPGSAALSGLDADLCVSFSGLKTALLRYVQKLTGASSAGDSFAEAAARPDGAVPYEMIPAVVASYQEAIVGAIADRTARALRRRAYRALIVGGGVSLNGRLRAKLKEVAEAAEVELMLAAPKNCGDNAAMIAGLAFYRRNLVGEEAMKVDVHPSLEAGDEP